MQKTKQVAKILILLLFFALFMIVNRKITYDKMYSIEKAVVDSRDYCYQMSTVYQDGNEVVLDGWFFSLKDDKGATDKLSLLLMPIDCKTGRLNDDGILASTIRTESQEVNQYFLCDKDLMQCGIQARISELGKPESLITFVSDRKGHDQRYVIDPSKANKELGWSPTTMFNDDIKLTIQWYKNHMDWMDECTSGEYVNYYEQMYATRKVLKE